MPTQSERPGGAGDVDRCLRVRGRVQGVGFRWWATRQAARLGVRGAIRNSEDGSVEVRVAGSADAVNEMVQRLHRGPSGARVEAVEEDSNALPLPPDFRITR